MTLQDKLLKFRRSFNEVQAYELLRRFRVPVQIYDNQGGVIEGLIISFDRRTILIKPKNNKKTILMMKENISLLTMTKNRTFQSVAEENNYTGSIKRPDQFPVLAPAKPKRPST